MRIQTFNFDVPITKALLWQYNSAVNLQSLIIKKQLWYDLNFTEFWNRWYTNVFNLVTADEFGLIVWAIILDIPLYIDPNEIRSDDYIWGFDEDRMPFDHGNFYDNDDILILSLEERRFILRLRYFETISRGALLEVNEFLVKIVPPLGGGVGTIYAIDNEDMTMTVKYDPLIIHDRLIQYLELYDIFPRPTGVKLVYVSL